MDVMMLERVVLAALLLWWSRGIWRGCAGVKTCLLTYKGSIMMFSACGKRYSVAGDAFLFCPNCGKRAERVTDIPEKVKVAKS